MCSGDKMVSCMHLHLTRWGCCRERKKQEKEDARRRVIEEAEKKKADEEEVSSLLNGILMRHGMSSMASKLNLSVLATQAKRQAEEAEKKKASEAKAVREAAKKLVKKERQRLRAINEGGGEL